MKSKFYFFAAILILTAVFTGCDKETYTVTFNPNGGTGTMQPQTFTEGEAQALNRNAFTYDGYTFTGWNTVQSGSGISYPDGQTITATMDMILYAQWTSNGSSGGGQQGGETPTPEPPVPAGCPTVETLTAEIEPISNQKFTLKLSGDVTAAGNAPVIARGFMYGTSADNFSNSVECGTGTGSFTKATTELDFLGDVTFYYKAYATNSIGTAYGEIKSFTISISITTGTGSLSGHDYVDLGLPSGTKWATCNIGATSPEAYGNYYAWGEIATKETYDQYTYRYFDGFNMSKYTRSDDRVILEACDDAATANWGSGWHMPTKARMEELKTNCIVTWMTQNGVNGCLFIGPNGNSIFLPAAGYRGGSSLTNAGSYGHYWSSSLNSSDTDYAWYLSFGSGNCDMNDYDRYSGRSVRAVCQSQN